MQIFENFKTAEKKLAHVEKCRDRAVQNLDDALRCLEKKEAEVLATALEGKNISISLAQEREAVETAKENLRRFEVAVETVRESKNQAAEEMRRKLFEIALEEYHQAVRELHAGLMEAAKKNEVVLEAFNKCVELGSGRESVVPVHWHDLSADNGGRSRVTIWAEGVSHNLLKIKLTH